MPKKILQKNEKVLRKISEAVPIENIQTTKIKKILQEMSEALKNESDGVAIAAPQIGYPLRIFVVSGKIFSENFIKDRKERIQKMRGNDVTVPDASEEKVESVKDLVFINPKISKLSRDKKWVPEGCLSVRPFYGKTFRSDKAIVTAYDETGRKFTRGASGLLAQIFQHETDHLDGILFIDHAKDVHAETPQK